MNRQFRTTVAAAVTGVLALGASAVGAEAQSQDTSTTRQGQQQATPAAPGQGGAADTSGYAEFKETMGKSKDTMSTAAGHTTNYKKHKKWKASGDSTHGQSRAAGMPQQGGPADTSGYAEFKETMGKAGDTLSTGPGTTNYRERKKYKASDSTSASGPSVDSSAKQ